MFNVNDPFIKDQEYQKILHHLKNRPPLCAVSEIIYLKTQILKAQKHQAYILHAGDCAEQFSKCNKNNTKRKQKQLCNLAKQINYPKDTIIIGRIAGQFAKPRSQTYLNNKLQYHGDIIHSINNRTPKAHRMLIAYNKSAEVIKHLKWPGKLIFTSHECLILDYEKCLTKNGYNLGAHLLWLGARSYTNIATIQYLANINNPIAVKVSENMFLNKLQNTLKQINPHNHNDKIILVTRLGHQQVFEHLPKIIKMTQSLPYQITWICDPMHANTHKDQHKKYRLINEIIAEINNTNTVLRMSGISLEITPDEVEECVEQLSHIPRKYKSLVDPRLNPKQAIKVLQNLKLLNQHD